MQDAHWEEQSPGNQEAPRPSGKAGEDMREPRYKKTDTNNPTHNFFLVVYKLIFTNFGLVLNFFDLSTFLLPLAPYGEISRYLSLQFLQPSLPPPT